MRIQFDFNPTVADRKKEKMAIRVIREIGRRYIRKQCKAVPKMTLRTKILIGDALETMYESPTVSVLRLRRSAF